MRFEGRKRIVGDLRSGGREPRQEGGFPGVGKTHQPDVGEQLELEFELDLLARAAVICSSWSTVGRCREARVAAATATALGDHHFLADLGQVAEDVVLAGNPDHRSRRHPQVNVLAAPTGLV